MSDLTDGKPWHYDKPREELEQWLRRAEARIERFRTLTPEDQTMSSWAGEDVAHARALLWEWDRAHANEEQQSEDTHDPER